MSEDITQLKREIMHDIYQNRLLLTSKRDRPEGWLLVSGIWSPFYIQLRLLSSFPKTLAKIGRAMARMIQEEAPHVNKLVGIAFAGIPIATAISLESEIPSVHTRKLTGIKSSADLQKALTSYGQHSLIEGVLEDGDVLCLVDDLVTGMTSKLTARVLVQEEANRRALSDVTCDDIAVLIDRQQGAKEAARDANLRLHALIDFVDEGLPTLQEYMPEDEFSVIQRYLENPAAFQQSNS